jgi:ATP-dependent phosphofructokinase / diphosphate-dependent phosphofructokinase
VHVGLITGGGDCPGLNAVIRAVTLALVRQCGARVTGIERGFEGLLTGRTRALAIADVHDILAQGGTILGTHNRCNPFRDDSQANVAAPLRLTPSGHTVQGADRSAQAMATAQALGLDAIVVIGGDGTMDIAHRFAQLGLAIVGVPKTIDNDLAHNDRSFGFDSAVAVVADALDRLATTARSHGRVMIAETMGRHAGWIALEGGIAGAADVIVIPELPYQLDALAEQTERRLTERGHVLVCVAEGAHGDDGAPVTQQLLLPDETPRLGGIAHRLERALAQRLQREVRATVLGHLQRGGTPTPFDRVLATQLGFEAAQRVRRGEYGCMVSLQCGAFTSVPLADVAGRFRAVDADHPLLQAAQGLGVAFGTATR